MLFLLVAAPVAGSQDVTPDPDHCERGTGTRGTVMVVWGPEGTARHCAWFRNAGYRVRTMPEIPDKWKAAWRFIVEQANRGPSPHFAYGWSRAGSLAEMLALKGKVDGAIAVAAPSDLTRWWNEFPEYWQQSNMTMQDRHDRSPLFNVPDHPVSLLLLHSPKDDAVPFWHSRKLHRRVEGSKLVRLDGNHTDHIRDVRRPSLQFLADQLTRVRK